jgi:DNA-directed RNA polymerase specialized sigma24 family protein
MSMLGAKLSLFDVVDVEAFCRAIVREHTMVGVRTTAGITGPSALSPGDSEDLLAYLIETTWELSQRYHGKDDGRGKLRFSGYAITILHKRCVDWKRKRWHATRYGAAPVMEELTEADRAQLADLVDLTGPEVLELVNSVELAEDHRRTLKLVVIPIVFAGGSVEDYSRRSGKPVSQVQREIGSLRRELERKQVLAA